MTLDHNGPAAKLFQSGVVGLAFDQNEIAATMLEARVEKPVLKRLLIGQEEQSFGIHVESAHGDASFWKVETGEGLLFFLAWVGIELTQESVGFVEGKKHGSNRRALGFRWRIDIV